MLTEISDELCVDLEDISILEKGCTANLNDKELRFWSLILKNGKHTLIREFEKNRIMELAHDDYQDRVRNEIVARLDEKRKCEC